MLKSIVSNIELSEENFRKISKTVYDHCGINLHDGKKQLVKARLAKLIRQNKFTSFEEYLDFIKNDESGFEFSKLIDSISTNLTSFFREPKHFNFISSVFLPDMLAKKKKTGRKRIRVWSAGCSSGEEPYSIGIALREAIPDFESWDVKILATDISTTVLDRARKGIYDEKRVQPVSASLKRRYFFSVKSDGIKKFQVMDNIKNMILFRYLNLMEPWPIKGPLDFIFCRNVMIYFDKPTQGKLVNRFYELLDKDGILFTGHSESLTGIRHNFAYIQPTIYKRP